MLKNELNTWGIKVDTDKSSAITRVARPQNKEGVQRILGILNYDSKCIPHFSADSSLIRELLKKNNEFKWESEHKKYLNAIKSKLIEAPVLQFYDVHKPVAISVDSCKDGTGVVIILQDNLPVAYASKALTETHKSAIHRLKNLFWAYTVPRLHLWQNRYCCRNC